MRSGSLTYERRRSAAQPAVAPQGAGACPAVAWRVLDAWRREGPALLRIALPLALAQLAQNGMGLVDTLMVGRLGPAELAGIALGSMLFFFVSIVSSSTIFAVGPLVAQATGAARPDEAAEHARHGVVLAFLLAGPVMTLLWFGGPVLERLGQDPSTAALATSYLRAVTWAVPGFMLFVALRAFLEGQGHTRPIMLISFAGIGANVLANNALMFGRWGFPALGLTGTGYATSLVYSLMALLLLLYVARYAQHHPVLRLARVSWARVGAIARLGWPIALTVGFETGLFAVTAVLMGLVGQTALAGHQIALQTVSFTFMIPLGLGVATTARVGHAVGRGDPAGVRAAGSIGIALSLAVMCLTASLYWLAPELVVGLFIDLHDPRNAEVVAFAVTFLRIGALFQLVDGLQVSAIGALRGLKDTRVPMLITLVSYWFVGLGSGVVFAFWLGLEGPGLWFGLVAGLAVAALWLTRRFAQLARRVG